MVLRNVLVGLLMAWVGVGCAGAQTTSGVRGAKVGGAGEFKVFEWTPHHRRLLAPGTGIQPIYLVQDGFWARGADGGWDRSKPDERATRATAWMLARKGVPVVIDIEHWPVDIRRADEATVRESLKKLAQIADWIHAERPEVKLGFYGLLPIQDYWTPAKYEGARREGRLSDGATPEEREMERWRKANALVAEYLKDRVDYVFPSLYTFYDDPAGWTIYARANLAEARKFGKPVYPFLRMDYHDSNARLKGHNLPREVWRDELDYCRRHADGLVIWGCWTTNGQGQYITPPWDEQAGWWQETLSFMRSLPTDGR